MIATAIISRAIVNRTLGIVMAWLRRRSGWSNRDPAEHPASNNAAGFSTPLQKWAGRPIIEGDFQDRLALPPPGLSLGCTSHRFGVAPARRTEERFNRLIGVERTSRQPQHPIGAQQQEHVVAPGYELLPGAPSV
jgi:hypothetical protein